MQTSEGFSDLTLHLVLATMPQGQEKIFNECIVDGYYGKYREHAKDFLPESDKESHWTTEGSEVPVLYNPLRYYLLGNYDIAYISLIDNFKFAQRVFEPQLLAEDKEIELFAPHTFQSCSGITYPGTKNLKGFFKNKLIKNEDSRRYFLAITNLKLNNGFLIGNGNLFLHQSIDYIRGVIRGYNAVLVDAKPVEFIVMQSFSWFEISLNIFADDPIHISSILKLLRRGVIEKLTNAKEILEKSLYGSIFEEEYSGGDIIKANIFSDSQTYFGLDSDLIDCKPDDPYLLQFLAKGIKLKTEVEWQVKPGHMAFLLKFLNESALSDIFNWDERYLLAGKNDYYIRNKRDEVNSNVKLLRLVLGQEPDSQLYNHVRKIRTRIQFEDGDIQDVDPRTFLDLHKKIVKDGVSIKEFSKIDKILKSLKISRQIRSKILKIFSNYNNGIQDIILFPFFLDFKLFITYLIKYITNTGAKLEEKFRKPSTHFPELNMGEIEHALMHLIGIFQEGYNIRMLNGYQFEDINDFDLDFNSSIQQLLSAYNTLAIEVGNIFYKESYFYGPIVQLNLKDTVSNYNSINYYVHHLTSPEFVFATLSKEIINFLYLGDPEMRKVIDGYEAMMSGYAVDNEKLQDLISYHHIDIAYLVNDASRLLITYDNEFELFQYWFWTYNLQNTSLYDETGLFNEDYFINELTRIIFSCRFFGHPAELLICPLVELRTFWERHFKPTLDAIEELLGHLTKNGLASQILNYVISTYMIALEKTIGNLNIGQDRYDPGAKFIATVQGQYTIEQLNMHSLNLITKKVLAYQILDAGDRDGEISSSSEIYLQWYMLHTLKTMHGLNKEIVLLRRNWADGSPLQTFLHGSSSAHLYSVDQTGGLFFDSAESIGKYMKLSSAMMSDIWDYSLKRKKIFMSNAIAKKE